MHGKTRDGFHLNDIVTATKVLVEEIPELGMRPGSNHEKVLTYPGMKACPIAQSTVVKTMLAPWLKQVTGYTSQYIRDSLRRGKWYK